MSKDKKEVREWALWIPEQRQPNPRDQLGQRPPGVAQEVFKEVAQVTPCVSDGHTAYAAGLGGNVVAQGQSHG